MSVASAVQRSHFIQLPGGDPTSVNLLGPTLVHAGIGNIGDNDSDGREEVAAEIVSMDLAGTSNLLGPVAVRVRPATSHPLAASVGEIEEQLNNTPNTLDTQPFTPTGSSDNFFDVFFEVDLGGQTYHNDTPLRLAAKITRKPPARDESLVSTNTVELMDPNDNPTGIYVVRTVHTPFWVERDTFPNSKLVVEMFGPLGPEIVTLKGPTRVDVAMGEIADGDGDGLEQVRTEMVEMSVPERREADRCSSTCGSECGRDPGHPAQSHDRSDEHHSGAAEAGEDPVGGLRPERPPGAHALQRNDGGRRPADHVGRAERPWREGAGRHLLHPARERESALGPEARDPALVGDGCDPGVVGHTPGPRPVY